MCIQASILKQKEMLLSNSSNLVILSLHQVRESKISREIKILSILKGGRNIIELIGVMLNKEEGYQSLVIKKYG